MGLCCDPVLREINLTVLPGEVLALVGSQGSGKSTLLQILAGRRLPTAGTAVVDGIDCRSPGIRRKVGVVGANWGLAPRLTVQEQMLLFARLWGLGERRVMEVLKPLELLEKLSTRAEQLRPGEAARLQVARALLHDPVALLLDEPIGDVDRESASLIDFTIREAAERGKAVLLATFGHPRSLGLATREAYLEGGQLVLPAAPQASTPAETPKAPDPPGRPIRHVAGRKDDRVLLFAPPEIHYAYAQEKAVYIQTESGPCAVSATLTELEERLAEEGFFRCHRAFLVNVNWVREITAWTRDSFSLILKDGREVPLSKHRAQELKERLGW